MRILLVSSGSGSRGGGEIFLDYLARGLTARGHEVTVWLPAHPRMDELADKCARPARVLRGAYRNTYDYRSRSLATCFNHHVSRRLAMEWGALHPGVIHLNKQNLEDGLDMLRALSLIPAPSVCTIHLTQTARYLRARGARLRDYIARSALLNFQGPLVAVQDARRMELHDFLGGRVHTETVYNGVPARDQAELPPLRARKRGELGYSDGDFLVIGLGRLAAQKRPFVFLETARALHRLLPAARFLWVGDGDLAGQWNEWVEREGLTGVIRCAGWQVDVAPFLAAGDLLLHVAEFEGLPLAIVEAMAAGLPCAVTRSFASEISLLDSTTVLFADDLTGLAAKLRDPAGLARLAGAARRLVEGRLSLDAMAGAYERLYRQVSGQGATGVAAA